MRSIIPNLLAVTVVMVAQTRLSAGEPDWASLAGDSISSRPSAFHGGDDFSRFVSSESVVPSIREEGGTVYKATQASFDVIPVADGYGTMSGADPWFALNTLEVFLGLEGSKQPQDFGVNAHFGGRTHVNWGVPISEEMGLGFQIGTGLNVTDHAVRVTSQIDGSGSRTQSFTTLGLFQRTDGGFLWAVAYDLLFENDYDEFELSQWRGKVGYFVSEFDEVGVQAMLPQNRDSGLWGPFLVNLDPIAQGHVYWRHTFESLAEVGGWIGVAEGHGRRNVALGDPDNLGEVVVFGSDMHVPLNDSWAIFGEANFICPADSGTVDAYLGFAYYPGGTAVEWRRRSFSPVLPVANNTSFSVDLSR